MCCRGCQAVARTIIDYGLENFYQYRTGASPKPDELVPDIVRQLQIYDDAGFQSGFVEDIGADAYAFGPYKAYCVKGIAFAHYSDRLSKIPHENLIMKNITIYTKIYNCREILI